MCDDVIASGPVDGRFEVAELRLNAHRFSENAAALLPGSRVEILCADVDDAEVALLLPQLTSWGIDRLRIVSPRREPLDWRAPSGRRDTVVTVTKWRAVPIERELLRALDLSALPIAEFRRDSTLAESVFLKSVILPTSLRVLPRFFFAGCGRLSYIGTAGCASLETIQVAACLGCRSLAEFWFPPSVRVVEVAFAGTAIRDFDLSETRAGHAGVADMAFLERVMAPRRTRLDYGWAVPALREVTFGALGGHFLGSWRPHQVRFECMKSPESPKLVDCRVHAEVAAVLSRESAPSFPL